MKEKVIEILKGIRSDIDFETEDQLIDGNIIDSFDVVSLIGDLTDEFDVDITVNDMIPENFNSADAIVALIQRLEDEI
ncbi:MAG TPA: acyl carrier protein [Clostridiales bacterium]|jgi:acyl carrier protein|nr:acyl carrier protein [Clostridiales bacterium]